MKFLSHAVLENILLFIIYKNLKNLITSGDGLKLGAATKIKFVMQQSLEVYQYIEIMHY